MSVYSQIGSAESLATLAEAQAIGEQISLTHRDNAAVDLYVLVVSQGLGKEIVRGRMKEVGILKVRVPVQAGFAVMTDTTRPVTEGDLIEYPLSSGRFFQVRQDEDIKQMSDGYEYEITAREHKTLTTGVMS